MAGIKQLGKKANVKPNGKQDRWLLKFFETQLTKKQSPPRHGVFFPSLISNTCDRYVYMAYTGMLPPSTIDANLTRIFDNGGSLEDRMNEYFLRMGILEGREISLKNEMPPISGRMDFLIRHEKYGGSVALELKSINTRGFENLKQAKPDHALQLQTYMNLYNATAKFPVTHGIVLYENKNDQKLKAFVEELDLNVWNGIIERLLNIMNMTKLPEKCTGDKWCKCKEV
jgi:hypothetical protein